MAAKNLQIAKTPEPTKTPRAPRTPKAPQLTPIARVLQSPQKLVALWAGGAGCAVLGLSVSHVASAIQAITGEGATSVLLAIGVDCGMCAAEVAEVVCASCPNTVAWAKRVVWGTLGLSAALNAWAFSARAASWGLWGLSLGLGVLTPFLVFGLFRVSTGAWRVGESGQVR